MTFKIFSSGLVLALATMCLCQSQPNSPPQYQSQSLSQSSFQNGPAVQTQTRLEDIERDLSPPTSPKPQQTLGKTPDSATPPSFQAQQPQTSSQILGYPQPQYYIQPYQGQQQLLAQQYPTTFDYSGLQYMFINPAAFNPQAFQQYYVQAPQPSAIPQYITKQSASSALLPSTPSPLNKQAPFEFKPQFSSSLISRDIPSLANFKQQQEQFVETAPSFANFKQQGQYIEGISNLANLSPSSPSPLNKQVPIESKLQFTSSSIPNNPALANFKQQQGQFAEATPNFQYIQQPQATYPAEFSFLTRHPTTPQTKSVSAAVAQSQIQYQQYQQPQFYVNVPSIPQQQQQSIASYNTISVDQPRIQPSLKSEFSSGIKSTTALPLKTSEFAYKFESTPQQPQRASNGAYSTLRFSS